MTGGGGGGAAEGAGICLGLRLFPAGCNTDETEERIERKVLVPYMSATGTGPPF